MDLIQLLDSPDEVGSGEYRALVELLHDALASYNGPDPPDTDTQLKLMLGALVGVEAWIDAIAERLTCSHEYDTSYRCSVCGLDRQRLAELVNEDMRLELATDIARLELVRPTRR